MRILKWGIYVLIFCLPLYLVRFEIFNIPTTLLEIMIYALFVLWLVGGFNFENFKRTVKENRLLFVAIFLIFLGASLATLHSWDLRLSAGIWKAWFVDPLLFFLVFISVIKSPKDLKNGFYSLILSGFFVSLVALVYLFFGKLDPEGRLQGFYNSPNYLAMYLAPITVVVLGFFAQIIYTKTRVGAPASRRAPSRPRPDHALGLRRVFLVNNLRPIFLILNSSLLILILFSTRSFGAWIGILGAIGLGLIIWFWSIKKKKTAVISAFLLLVLCIAIYFVKFNTIAGKLSIGTRMEIWQRAINAVQIYPVIGIGPGTFKDFFPDNASWQIPQPHNLYLAFLLQTGVVGFIGLFLLLFWFFKTGIKNQKSEIINIITISVMAYILIHGLVDTTYWKNDLAIVFWMVIAAMLASKQSLISEL